MLSNSSTARYCLVFMCGHLPVTGEYLATDGSSPIVVGLSKGWHVLVIPMPSFDWNQAASTQNIVVGGVLTPLFEHNYPSLDTDGGPTSSRMFTDQVIRASNQVMAEIRLLNGYCQDILVEGVLVLG